MIATKQTSYLQFAELVAISTLHTIATVNCSYFDLQAQIIRLWDFIHKIV